MIDELKFKYKVENDRLFEQVFVKIIQKNEK